LQANFGGYTNKQTALTTLSTPLDTAGGFLSEAIHAYRTFC